MSTPLDQLEVPELVRLAAGGDQSAWNELVRRYAPVVWRVARAHRLNAADAGDVCQNTWFALATHLTEIRQPDRLVAWLANTTRRHAVRLLASRRREVYPEWWPESLEDSQPEYWPEPHALRRTRDRLLWQAFAALPDRCQRLLGLLAHAPELSYAQLARALGMKTGSVGPSRGRCLHELRRHLTKLGWCEGAAG